MSFLRHGEIFPSDGAPTLGSNAPAHRLDESPVGYSLTGWSPPVPGSASPTKTSILQKDPDGRKIFIAVDFRFWARKTRNSSVTFLLEATRTERQLDARQSPSVHAARSSFALSWSSCPLPFRRTLLSPHLGSKRSILRSHLAKSTRMSC